MNRTRILSFAFALCLLTAAAAGAAPLEGEGIIEGKDVAKRLLVIEGETYEVALDATIRWKDGPSATLRTLPAADLTNPADLHPLLRATYHGETTPSGASVLDRIELEHAKE